MPREAVWVPMPGIIQGQVGQDFEQTDLVEDVPAHRMELEMDDLERSFPTQTTL